jgi:hypothetical protein
VKLEELQPAAGLPAQAVVATSPAGRKQDRAVPTRDREPARPPSRHPCCGFHGTVTLDPQRVGRDAARIAEDVISHLVGQVGVNVTVTEIEATVPGGASEQVVCVVTDNSRTSKFSSHGFGTE